jgi:16S rRNA (cytosine1402-N4)-methyltransferase
MEYRHAPALYQEVRAGLSPNRGAVCADGTLGGGGHGAGICEAIGEAGTFLGIDRDPEALVAAKEKLRAYPCRKLFENRNYEEIEGILQENGVAGIDSGLLDLGVSSKQLDDATRGFSYMHDGPLDMRMEGSEAGGCSAADIVNTYTEEALSRVIFTYGEERWANRIAHFIVRARAEASVETTGALVNIIKAAIPASARRDGPHPAKRTFQALRIEANDELETLKRALDVWMNALNSGGRLAVITFHSLEDRIVKEAFQKRENPCTCPSDIPVCACGRTADAKRVNRKPILPSEEEIASNPRVRSAKLRFIEKL